MEDPKLEKLRFPVGRFTAPESITSEEINKWIKEIEELPVLCRNELRNFTEEMLNQTYRPDGWTSRQVIHHIVDSHMNAYIRFKLTLTEEFPAIRPYNEANWAKLDDSMFAPPEISLSLLEALHRRWVIVIKSLNDDDLNRRYFHPESKKEFTLKSALALYAWHGRHHLEHIKIVKRKFASANV